MARSELLCTAGGRIDARPPVFVAVPPWWVIASFRRPVAEGELRLHPQIGVLVEKEMLETMGASDQQKGAN